MCKGQSTKRYSDLLLENNIVHACVPPNLARKFPSLEINVNRVAKSFFKSRFQMWYSDEITKQMNEGKGIYAVDVNTCLSRMKAIHACWIIGLYDKLWNSEEWSSANLKRPQIQKCQIYRRISGKRAHFFIWFSVI